MVQLSHLYLTPGKARNLTVWTLVGKVMSLLLNTLTRFVIAFLPKRKHLLISWLQSLSPVILEPKKIKSVTVSIISPFICHGVMEPDAMILVFLMLSFKPAFSLSSFTFIKRLFSSSLLSVITEVGVICISKVIDISPSNLDYSLCFILPSISHDVLCIKLNKQGDNIQPWCVPFPILNQSVVPCLVLTVASWPAYRYFRRQVRWSGTPTFLRIFQFAVIHIVKGFGVVSEAEVFLEFLCFFCDPVDTGNLISGSFAFSKSSLYHWKFLVHILVNGFWAWFWILQLGGFWALPC